VNQNLILTEDPLLHYYHRVNQSPTLHHSLELNAVPPEIGKGAVTCLFIEEGICAGYYDIEFSEDQHFSFPANNQDAETPVFRLVFSLGANTVCEEGRSPFWITTNKTSFYSINFERTAFLPKNKRYRSIDLIFSKEWLDMNFSSKSERVYNLVQVLSKKKNPTLLLELLDKSTYIVAENIACGLKQNNIALLSIKAQVFTLLNNFFHRALQRSQRNLKKNQALYYDQIKAIEKSLAQYYTEELPKISALAKEFNISPSTLKRHFKHIYNRSIYDYYLEQKMALGMAMLEEKKSSVSEVAYRLGYHKVNSFSKIFKKHFGILPSQCE
jgi:AraC-like DNA-binding protein